MKKSALILGALFLLASPTSALAYNLSGAKVSSLAYNRGLVLDEATSSNQPIASTAGPGHLLPDNPLYFVDLWRDNLRFFLTAKPEERAKLNMEIAGERLAELKIMLDRQSPKGISLALENLTARIEDAKNILRKERSKGKDVAALAHDLNEGIEQDQEFLAKLEKRTQNQDKFLVRAAQTKIAQAEIEVENELPADEQEKEQIKELSQGITESLDDASDSVLGASSLARKLESKSKNSQKLKVATSKPATAAAEKVAKTPAAAIQEILRATQELMQQTRSSVEALQKLGQNAETPQK